MARKQTSSRVSTLAAKLMALANGTGQHWVFVPTGDIKTLCASLLSQDEIAGQAPRRKQPRGKK